MKIFAVINQKGGTGKTTVAVNLASRLAGLGRSVLLVDMDPQGNATSGSGADKQNLFGGTLDVLHGASLRDYLLCSTAGGYALLGANYELAGADYALGNAEGWQTTLRRALREKESQTGALAEVVLIDCPPALGALTVNALVAADSVLIPMQCEYFALEGLSDLARTIRRLRQKWNPQLHIGGIICSMMDPRNLLARDISEELRRHFGERVFNVAIRRNVRVAEAPSHGMPVLQYAPNSAGAAGYRALGDEFMERFL
ncbi:MAG: ParA family protein [Gammaproteobacteria bacterium]